MSHRNAAEDRIGDLLRSASDDQLARALHADAEGIVRAVLGRRDPHLIQTAVNDALCAVVRYRDGFRGESRGSSWLYVVARREALRVAAREARATRGERRLDEVNIDTLTERAAQESRPDAALIGHALLNELVPNPVWRRIWLLYNDPDLRLSHAEIADCTGRTVGTVAVTLSRVRALIAEARVESMA